MAEILGIHVPFTDSEPAREFNVELQHGHSYEMIFDIKGEWTPEKYVDIRSKLMSKLPEYSWEECSFNADSGELVVRMRYDSPAIPLIAWGAITLISTALACWGISLTCKSFKEIATPVGNILQTIVVGLAIFFIGYYLLFKRGS